MALSKSRPAPGFLRAYLQPRRHRALLIAIIILFLVRPLIGDVGAGPVIFSTCLMLLMLMALYAIQVDDETGGGGRQRGDRTRRVIGWVLALMALVERIAAVLAPTHDLILLGSVGWLCFFGFVTYSQLRSLLRQKVITGEIISMSVSVYLLMGMTWGLLYVVLFQRHPDAFSFGNGDPAASMEYNRAHLFPVFIYFSLTTLSTIGFGDITPITLQARYAAVAEGITGQFYLAILVARLVSMQMSRTSHDA
jgi:hypothetical protein